VIDYSKYATTSAEPEPSSMIETFRAIGYNTQSAIADIIDNSISAAAKNIWISFEWRGIDTLLSIKDDGSGMSNDELIQAMRPGSRNPKVERTVKDLGRFGLGLKTASFSQCRRLSVLTKKLVGTEAFWTWDLDYVNRTGKWDLVKYLPGQFIKGLNGAESGTIVIWNNLDRLVKDLHEDDSSSLDRFLQIMEQVKKHLSMVFHRFIENRNINIYFQDKPIDSWNPFLPDCGATQKFPEEFLQRNRVKIRGFVLPHRSKLALEEFKEGEGPKGWNEQQGFYIYRNERLLVAGDWIGMFRKEEHYKLARIMVDLPNSLDAEWQIDIKKSVARPPLILRDQLKAYANKVRSQAVEVYRHKGKVLQRKYSKIQFQPVWNEKIRHGKRFYEINKDHPIILSVMESLKKNLVEINQLLQLIQETVPVPLITIKESEQPELQGFPFEGINHASIIEMMRLLYKSFIEQNKTDEEARSTILNIEPFNNYPQYIDQILS
jgi:Histidine kinase-, DNA gyrase B-, and HSP90-like ATPase